MFTTHEVKKVDPGEVRHILVAHSQQLDPRECQVMSERKSTHYVKQYVTGSKVTCCVVQPASQQPGPSPPSGQDDEECPQTLSKISSNETNESPIVCMGPHWLPVINKRNNLSTH